MAEEHKFGTLKGVFVPNVTMMFGVILFMRLGLIVGNVGLCAYLSIIAISLFFMTITSLSIAMIVTNMQVGGGGAYFLISRSVGIEVGGALGIGLILSQIISLAVCVTGFSYSLYFLIPDIPVIFIELLTLLGLAAISFISADLALKLQFLVFCLLLTAVTSIFIFTDPDQAYALAGEPFFFSKPLTFWQGFALFYPAMTGIEAGMALSGSLRNPSRSLWVGCLTALLVVAAVYALVGSYAWFVFPRSFLEASELILVRTSRVPALIYAGIWCATLSSALGNFLGGPRMLQSLAEDGVAPAPLKKGYGPHHEPRLAVALTFAVALVMILGTTIDQILPIAAMICLMTYGTFNVTAAVAELIHAPSWRPSIRIPWWLSLLAAALAFFLMLMISIPWTFVTFVCVAGFYSLIRFLSVDVTFRDLRQNIIFFLSRLAVYHMTEQEDNPHHWHPQLLAFSKAPSNDLGLLQFSSCMARRSGILTVATLLPEAWEEEQAAKKEAIAQFLEKNAINGLLEVIATQEPQMGIENLIKTYGIGQLQPNTVILNLASELNDWQLVMNTIKVAKLHNKNLILFHDVTTRKEGLFSESSYRRRKIAVCWDKDDTAAFELMLSYVHSLTSNITWRRSQCVIHHAAQDDKARQHVRRYLKAFVQSSRVQVEVKVDIDSQSTNGFPKFDKYLKGYDLAFIPLRPYEDEENEEKYLAYLKEYYAVLPQKTPVALVTSYDALNHAEIYVDYSY